MDVAALRVCRIERCDYIGLYKAVNQKYRYFLLIKP